MLRKVLFILSLCLIPALNSVSHLSAQDILRIELDAGNLSLPFYTIPLGDHGFVVIKGEEIRNRRINTFELFHYDILFQLIDKKVIRSERAGNLSGWEVTDSAVVLLFLEDQSGLSGGFVHYFFHRAEIKASKFTFPNIHFSDPFLIANPTTVFLTGVVLPRSKGLFHRKSSESQRALFVLSQNCSSDSVILVTFKAANTVQLVRAIPQPDNNILFITKAANGKFSEKTILSYYNTETNTLTPRGWLPSSMSQYLIDMRTGKFPNSTLALIGTYGTRSKKTWNSSEPVPAEGFFIGFPETTQIDENQIRFYPFSQFTNFTSSLRQHYFKNRNTITRNSSPKNQQAWRMLLHDDLYTHDSEMVLVAEAFYPEYEYESRPQSYYNPYYGYYSGFYDTQSRWVFKGFRYDHAVVAAFNPQGKMVWENSVETSNILDKNLTARLNLLPVGDETVLVYAHEGRIWYRVIKSSDIVVDKESYPIELPAPDDKVKEHFTMNMAPWYAHYFLAWGRQTIRNNRGKNRTIYYCTKLAFE